ncbi:MULTISPECIES: phage major capsid protein [Enterobacteriaceae]|jgi:HK97 family phage major capsid protein|uniref:Phage major capsid protein n=3 Tax=Enterobacteriaceae TaxID=543 RepID=A0ABD7KT65_9ENTR|nr:MULTISPECIES: phage major capsid protein [Enterobacteriaceae]EDY2766419.1 phage major capsid protein [Salmonella enterica subsp. enterica serovar Albany]EFH3743337.1 phage major capsid protein [Escherichia coli]QAR65973.1 phage major capsid protein [Citrobacter sp. SL156]EHN8876801.1 phage major capsid protein [Enterobacter hormaechei]EIV2907383.1 phage major capsid protein [Citrobacter braakii]
MSELALIQKAIEESQQKMSQLFDAQKAEIESTGQVSKQLQSDLAKVQEELTKSGTRLFDLEQKLASGADNPGEKKSFSERAAEELIKSWDGKQGTFDAKTFNKSLGSDADSAGSLIQPMQIPGIIMPGLRRLTIRDLLAQGRISSNALEYVREEVFTNNADVVAEKALKPESDITFSKQTANVKTIAHWVQASRQVMDDAPMLQSYVNNRLMYGLALKEEGQLLNGDGTGDNIEGLNKVATAYDTSLNATGDTRADIIAHAIYQVTESEFSASGIVLNPRDWHNIALLKDNEGRYIFGGPQAFTSNIMWGLPVVPTKAQAAGTFTVGGFDMASQVWDRMNATVEVSRDDRDNFVKNMLTILCEERLALAHYRPAAIIKGTFSSGS